MGVFLITLYVQSEAAGTWSSMRMPDHGEPGNAEAYTTGAMYDDAGEMTYGTFLQSGSRSRPCQTRCARARQYPGVVEMSESAISNTDKVVECERLYRSFTVPCDGEVERSSRDACQQSI